MGGNTFNQSRLPREAYLRLQAQLVPLLDELFGSDWRIPLFHTDKADFGDLDVLVSHPHLTAERLRTFQAASGATQYVKHNVGHSFLVPADTGQSLQVDLLPTPAEVLDTRHAFMSWGDCGNILGRMVKPLGLRWGEEGLEAYHRADDNPAWRRLKLLSRDINVTLQLLQLDPQQYHAGFATERAMFAYLSASPFFERYPYLHPEGLLRRKAATRPGMQRFIAYLQETGDDPGLKPRRRTPAEVDALLPGSGIAAFHAACVAEYEQLERVRTHFNGDLVMALTGLQGKALGALMSRIKGPATALAEQGDDAAIRDLILREAASVTE